MVFGKKELSKEEKTKKVQEPPKITATEEKLPEFKIDLNERIVKVENTLCRINEIIDNIGKSTQTPENIEQKKKNIEELEHNINAVLDKIIALLDIKIEETNVQEQLDLNVKWYADPECPKYNLIAGNSHHFLVELARIKPQIEAQIDNITLLFNNWKTQLSG